MPLVSALTGLPTRWSGVVELVEGADFKGKKRFACDIQISADLANQDVRWSTLIHESLHCHSAGYNIEHYQSFPGWEEGVVEKMQRLLRVDILTRIGVFVPDTVLAGLDAEHRYNVYVQALEAVRFSLAISEAQFYQRLLATPLQERAPKMLMQARQLPPSQQRGALEIISAANATLKQPISRDHFFR